MKHLLIERSETTYRMHSDGTGERDLHVVVRIQSQGAAQQFGVLSFAYASANETPQIKLIRVRKPDGTTVDTPADTAIDMPANVTREAPLYSDLKEKHVPVRSISAGDTLEYEVDTRIEKPEAPGQFWGANALYLAGDGDRAGRSAYAGGASRQVRAGLESESQRHGSGEEWTAHVYVECLATCYGSEENG